MQATKSSRFDPLTQHALLGLDETGCGHIVRYSDECVTLHYRNCLTDELERLLLRQIGELRATHRHAAIFDYNGYTFTSAHGIGNFRFRHVVNEILNQFTDSDRRAMLCGGRLRDILATYDQSKFSDIEQRLQNAIWPIPFPDSVRTQLEFEIELIASSINQGEERKSLTKEQILKAPDANNDSSNWREWSSIKQYAERGRIPELNEHLNKIEAKINRFCREWRNLKGEVIGLGNGFESRANAAFYAVLANKFNLRPDEVANFSCETIAGYVDAIEILSSSDILETTEPPAELVANAGQQIQKMLSYLWDNRNCRRATLERHVWNGSPPSDGAFKKALNRLRNHLIEHDRLDIIISEKGMYVTLEIAK